MEYPTSHLHFLGIQTSLIIKTDEREIYQENTSYISGMFHDFHGIPGESVA